MRVEDQIRAISDAWDAALIANDAGAVAGFMADDWVFVGPTGVTPKREIIDWIESGRLSHHSMQAIGDVRIVVNGDVAVLTARKASTGTWEGTPYTADEWLSEVYVKQGRGWPCILSHKSAVDPPSDLGP
jgi:uncharacterized protein (TIGR02246 family)